MPWKGRMGYMNSGALLPAIFFYWLGFLLAILLLVHRLGSTAVESHLVRNLG